MKTLILNGSPRKNGDTAQLLELAKAQLQGTYHVVSAYTADIHPCIDCRHCQKQFGCIFADEMEAVYTYLKDCDRILLASPIYFSELTGSLLNVISRLQPYFYARYFRKEPIPLHIQKAVTVLVGGGTGSPKRHMIPQLVFFNYCRSKNNIRFSVPIIQTKFQQLRIWILCRRFKKPCIS